MRAGSPALVDRRDPGLASRHKGQLQHGDGAVTEGADPQAATVSARQGPGQAQAVTTARFGVVAHARRAPSMVI